MVGSASSKFEVSGIAPERVGRFKALGVCAEEELLRLCEYSPGTGEEEEEIDLVGLSDARSTVDATCQTLVPRPLVGNVC